MNNITTKTFLILLVLQMTVIGCGEKSSTGPLIGKIQDESLNLVISTEKIQNGLTNLFSPSGNNFVVKSVEIIEYQNRYFLRITGNENQKCMVALKESKGDLFELNDNNLPIVICSGCPDGCEPLFAEGGWYCSEGCPQCIKTSSVSDHYIFE
ncbi:MAG: hypothetical protein HQ522_18870 [Bacteroidetes bacterium]|nr:hypothetical protein [Bacteroidota bacterium]